MSTRSLALLAAAFAAVAVLLLASAWLFNRPPADASCETTAGYAAIKSHSEANASVALIALLCTALSGVVCLAGAVRAAGYRLLFGLAVLPLVALGFVSLVVVIGSGLYCQN
jgi:hypothetical protein